jgi:hypothetical protein
MTLRRMGLAVMLMLAATSGVAAAPADDGSNGQFYRGRVNYFGIGAHLHF